MHVCLEMNGNFEGFELFSRQFNCLRMGDKGIKVLKPGEGSGLTRPPGLEAEIDAGTEDIDDYDEGNLQPDRGQWAVGRMATAAFVLRSEAGRPYKDDAGGSAVQTVQRVNFRQTFLSNNEAFSNSCPQQQQQQNQHQQRGRTAAVASTRRSPTICSNAFKRLVKLVTQNRACNNLLAQQHEILCRMLMKNSMDNVVADTNQQEQQPASQHPRIPTPQELQFNIQRRTVQDAVRAGLRTGRPAVYLVRLPQHPVQFFIVEPPERNNSPRRQLPT
ncbi:conserved hypothetical protein [Culex quinquefasciatus]|uniref:Uncharacterized protein n=1 Tax=Culex quinquefasciatus TaxID=7176 RepID=B0XKR2_CULQU|nr:conserved hypothetical protein [Culex quinquefasciatus]|eukprot:XP_001870234.1 conserved hypothetical protein [Culex quinquefasciatus]